MAYRPTYKNDTDVELKALIPQAPSYTTVAALCDTGIRPGTVRNSLKRLCDAGTIQRTWVDEMVGHYAYSIPTNETRECESTPSDAEMLGRESTGYL